VTLTISAFLCEVQRQERPQESNRNPTWFSPEKTKRRLAEDRSPRDAAEFSQVIDRAVARIQRLLLAENSAPDALQQVQFEAPPPATTRIQQVTLARYVRAASAAGDSAVEFALGARVSKVLPTPRQPASLSAARAQDGGDMILPPKGQLIELRRRKRR
jgi:nucleoid-associated protein YgaU